MVVDLLECQLDYASDTATVSHIIMQQVSAHHCFAVERPGSCDCLAASKSSGGSLCTCLGRAPEMESWRQGYGARGSRLIHPLGMETVSKPFLCYVSSILSQISGCLTMADFIAMCMGDCLRYSQLQLPGPIFRSVFCQSRWTSSTILASHHGNGSTGEKRRSSI